MSGTFSTRSIVSSLQPVLVTKSQDHAAHIRLVGLWAVRRPGLTQYLCYHPRPNLPTLTLCIVVSNGRSAPGMIYETIIFPTHGLIAIHLWRRQV